jgi:hypothetical protein
MGLFWKKDPLLDTFSHFSSGSLIKWLIIASDQFVFFGFSSHKKDQSV